MLKPQVITGLNFLDITPGENKDKLLKESSSDKLPVIKYAPSFLSKVDASIPSLMDNVQKIMLKIDTVLSERNIDELSKLLKNLRIATEKVSVAMDGANTMIDGSKELPAELKKSLIEIQKAAKSASDTANSLDGRIKKGDFDFKDEVKNLSEKTDRLLEKLGDVAAASNTMINDINNTIADFFILALCFVKLGFNARYLINSLFIKLYFFISSSKLISGLKAKNIDLDRKVLSELAVSEPKAFTKIVESIK